MTPMQIKLARHALGLPNHMRRSYRNRYYASANGPHYEAWQGLVSAGLAQGERLASGMVYYELNEQGARMALEGGERLCPEDFPPVSNGDRQP